VGGERCSVVLGYSGGKGETRGRGRGVGRVEGLKL